jgi:hypothetical protein
MRNPILRYFKYCHLKKQSSESIRILSSNKTMRIESVIKDEKDWF